MVDQQKYELLGTLIGDKPKSYPGLAHVAHKLSDLVREVTTLEAENFELKQIRATLLLNFGCTSSQNRSGLILSENQTTMEMLLTVLQDYMNRSLPLAASKEYEKKEEKKE